MIKNFNYLSFFNFLKKKSLVYEIYKNNVVVLRALQINKKNIIFDCNLKSECCIKKSEFINKGFLEIKKGDFVEAFLRNVENRNGRIIFSRIRLKKYLFWKKISSSFKKKIFIKGRVLKKIKGGYTVVIDDFNCFLPFSCSDKKISNVTYYLDKDLYFLILSFDFKKKNIILSRKAVIFEILKIKRKLFFKNVKPGSLIKGIVKIITNYCVFIDIGYLDCIIYFKNLMWGNYKYSNECFKIGQSVLTVILKIDSKKRRVFLGVKQLFNPWKKLKHVTGLIKYVRILRINTHNIYVVIGKNIIASTKNYFNRKIFNVIKINNYLKISIKKLNFRRKRVNFDFKPPLAQ